MSWINQYLRHECGNVSVFLGLAAAILVGGAGSAIDYARLVDKRTTYDSAADAAVLAAIAIPNENPTGSHKALLKLAEAAALQAWQSNLSADEYSLIPSPAFKLEKKGNEWKASIVYAKAMPSSFLSVIGINELPLHGKAEAGSGGGSSKFWEFHVAVDTSSSMGIGATQADMDGMQADPKINCMFACHFVAGASGDDSVDYARDGGYKLRIDVVDDAVNSMMTLLDGASSLNARAALYGFANSAVPLVSLTNKLGDVKDHAIQLELSTASEGNTNYRQIMSDLTTTVGASGDGSSASKPKKALFIVTDGVHDSTVTESNVVINQGLLHQLGTIDPAFCDALKSTGVLVGVLYINYIVPAGYEGYVNAYQDQILPSLQSCASEKMFFNATTPEGIDAALAELTNMALAGDIRLTQ